MQCLIRSRLMRLIMAGSGQPTMFHGTFIISPKHSMHKLMKKHNFKVDTIHPMWFDSFYVGMLSTKYRGGNTNLFDSLKTGITSNIKGEFS